MKIPQNITKADLIKAADKIIEEGIPKGAQSTTYDVFYKNELLPPKLIVSYANYFRNNEELERTSFEGGLNTPCFGLLMENDFQIIKKPRHLEKAYAEYINSENKKNSGKAQSYIRSLEILNTYIPQSKKQNIAELENIYTVYQTSHIELIIAWVKANASSEDYGEFNDLSTKSYIEKGFFSAALNSYKSFLSNKVMRPINIGELSKNDSNVNSDISFDIDSLIRGIQTSGLLISKTLLTRFVASLLTKPFVILSGLSGSGKTKLAQAFTQWICQDESQYCIVPVGADWTNREPLLGYPNALKTDEYVKPDNGALDLIISANNNPDLPHFLILDEMNLSHVERYFADFLSLMESKGKLSLYAEGAECHGVPATLSLPDNLFIIGTVNIDETTYMFSPKVLDRANAIEFRVTKTEMESFFANQQDVDMSKLQTKGASMAKSFLSLAANKEFTKQDLNETHKTLINFFEQLKKTGAEFGYRSATEIVRLINQLTVIDPSLSNNQKLDIAIMQKLLPKLHGSRRKLCPVLITLASFCVDKEKFQNIEKDIFAKDDFDFESDGIKYAISLEKITRMYKGAIENGFASYAEA
ncbi:McrB family protein [Saccharicrinis aurantiacus]|uniref:McrB family protein n=1 Tax=Saccharicrinis aurantiacus TaxID=1849719 RepID=UPI00083930CE|nr:hypothetical protein [Saccharicrinis aurantiacus]